MITNLEIFLEFVELYPQIFDLNAIRHWENWTPEEAQKDEKYCDEWLVRFYCETNMDIVTMCGIEFFVERLCGK